FLSPRTATIDSSSASTAASPQVASQNGHTRSNVVRTRFATLGQQIALEGALAKTSIFSPPVRLAVPVRLYVEGRPSAERADREPWTHEEITMPTIETTLSRRALIGSGLVAES